MQKLDRLVWAEGFSGTCHGLRLGVRFTDPEAGAEIRTRLPPGWRDRRSPFVEHLYSVVVGGAGTRPGVRRLHVAYAGSVQFARTAQWPELLDALEDDLRMYVAERARRRVFVHAGAVGWRGSAIVIPGRSFSGKSSLVAALVRAGAEYYSDEYAVFDGHGRLHPYPIPLSLRSADRKEHWRAEADALGGVVGQRPLPVRLVALMPYRAGDARPPRRLSRGEGVLALLEHTVPARHDPPTVMATLKQVVSMATVVKGTRGEASAAASELLERVEAIG